MTWRIPAICTSGDTNVEAMLSLQHIDEYSVSVRCIVIQNSLGSTKPEWGFRSCRWWWWDEKWQWVSQGHHGSFCTETSFYTEDIYIYLFIYLYIFIFTHTHKHTRTRARAHTHTHTHTHTHKRSLIGFLCSSKNRWQPVSQAKKKAFMLLTVSTVDSLSKADTCVYLTSGTSSCLGQE
jgi:hypothetical protein